MPEIIWKGGAKNPARRYSIRAIGARPLGCLAKVG